MAAKELSIILKRRSFEKDETKSLAQAEREIQSLGRRKDLKQEGEQPPSPKMEREQ